MRGRSTRCTVAPRPMSATRRRDAGAFFGYSTNYAELRGRQFRGPAKVVNFVGGFATDAAKRTCPRRLTAWAFPTDPVNEGESPAPTPWRSRTRSATASSTRYWRSGVADRTSWLGQKLTNTPTDLFVYQEIIEELRPDWIIETGTREGGRALFLASVCDLVGHGRVVSVGNGGHRPARAPTGQLHRGSFDRRRDPRQGARDRRRRTERPGHPRDTRSRGRRCVPSSSSTSRSSRSVPTPSSSTRS